jgi:putative ABC transport system permease protein
MIRAYAEAAAADLRFAVRAMKRRKMWTVGALTTLSLGIGAASAVFTVVNALILHPLFYPGADRIAEVRLRPKNHADPRVVYNPSPRVLGLWQRTAHSVDAIEPIPSADALIQFDGQAAVLVQAVRIQPGFLQFAGQKPLAGRDFESRDTAFDAEPRVLLGERLWRDQFAADPRIIGHHLVVDSSVATIVGVAPAALHVPNEHAGGVGLWIAYSGSANVAPVRALVRLRSRVAVDAARNELDNINSRDEGGNTISGAAVTVVLTPLWQLIPFRAALALLTLAVALVLLLSCGNVAHMLLARGASRTRELAIRSAIGATTTRIWSQLIMESTVLTATASALGLVFAVGALKLLAIARPPSIAELDAARPNAFVFAAATAFACITGIVFGTLQLPRPQRSSLFGGGRATAIVSGESPLRGTRALIVTEAAMAFAILFGTVSLVHAVIRLQHGDPGFQTSNLYSVRMRPSAAGQITAELMDDFARQVSALPSVARVTFASQVPPDVGALRVPNAVEIEGQAPLPSGTIPRIGYNRVASDFFAVTGVRLLQGGTFTDTTRNAGQVILSRTTAHRIWPNESAIGRRFRLEPADPWQVVVGVAADVAAGGLAPESREQVIYLPLTTHAVPVLIVRTTGDAAAPAAIRRIAARIAARMPPPTLRSVDDAMAQSIDRPMFVMRVLSIFAEVCVFLTALGVYGVLSHAVEQRRKEIGIRLALGGSTQSIGLSVLAQALRPAVLGIGAGLLTIPWTRGVLRATVGGAGTIDGTAIIVTTALLVATAFVASLLPAGRAMRTDPALTLRLE